MPVHQVYWKWEEAFDKVDHERMQNTSERFRIPNNMTSQCSSVWESAIPS